MIFISPNFQKDNGIPFGNLQIHYRTVFLSRYEPIGYVSLLANI